MLSLWFGVRAASMSGARTYGELGAVVGARAWLGTELILALVLFGVVTSLVILCHDCLEDGIAGVRERLGNGPHGSSTSNRSIALGIDSPALSSS